MSHLSKHHREVHRSGRAGWLRPAVLASNDAIVSTASIMVGVAASAASGRATLIAGVAGMVAGAMSMAVGEYVTVSSQRDAERADIAREQHELATEPVAELDQLMRIYMARGLDEDFARQVATRLSAHDRLGAHLRDELGIEIREPLAPAPGRLDLGRELRPLRAHSHRGAPGRAGLCASPRLPSCRSPASPHWVPSELTWVARGSAAPRCA